MKTLFNNLPVEEQDEDESIFTYGDEIAYQFYCGNFTDAVGMLREMNMRAKDFLEYLENRAEDFGYNNICNDEFYNNHFSPEFWIALGSEIY